MSFQSSCFILFKRYIRYPLEATVTYLAYFIINSLSMERASWLIGWTARKIGHLSKASTVARRNLKCSLPHLSETEIEQTILGVWDNFGRVIGEYPHLKSLKIYEDPRFEIIGAEYLDQLREDGKPGIIVSAHLASWEVAIIAATQRGVNVTQLYRATNNPYVDQLVRRVQQEIGQQVLTKGRADAKLILKALLEGRHLFILMDQKLNEGIPVSFFGRPAMTAPAAARLALRLRCPLILARVERLGAVRFRITFSPPLTLPGEEVPPQEATYQVVQNITTAFENWIRARPEQWLWIHQRWPKGSEL